MDNHEATLWLVSELLKFWSRIPTRAWYSCPLQLASDLAEEGYKNTDPQKWARLMTHAYFMLEGKQGYDQYPPLAKLA